MDIDQGSHEILRSALEASDFFGQAEQRLAELRTMYSERPESRFLEDAFAEYLRHQLTTLLGSVVSRMSVLGGSRDFEFNFDQVGHAANFFERAKISLQRSLGILLRNDVHYIFNLSDPERPDIEGLSRDPQKGFGYSARQVEGGEFYELGSFANGCFKAGMRLVIGSSPWLFTGEADGNNYIGNWCFPSGEQFLGKAFENGDLKGAIKVGSECYLGVFRGSAPTPDNCSEIPFDKSFRIPLPEALEYFDVSED